MLVIYNYFTTLKALTLYIKLIIYKSCECLDQLPNPLNPKHLNESTNQLFFPVESVQLILEFYL
jgi:hypothetical protein